MAEFTLRETEPKTLKLNIGEESYQIPLGGSIPRKELVLLETADGTYSFFLKYIPKKVLESLSVDSHNQIVQVWRTETQNASQMTLGE